MNMAATPIPKWGSDLQKEMNQRFDAQDKRMDKRFFEQDRKIGETRMLVEENNSLIKAMGEGFTLLSRKMDEFGQRLDETNRKIERGYTPLTMHAALDRRVTKLEK